MAIKINNTTVIDDSRNIQNIGIATANAFKGSAQVGVGTSGVYLGLTTQFNFVGSGITITPTYNSTAGITTLTFIAGSSGGGNITISNDTSTNATYYVGYATVTSGSATIIGISTSKLTFNPSTGNLSATQFTSLSDVSKKTNIHPIENPIQLTQQLNGVRFDWIDNGKKSIGVIAQELEKVLPELVETSTDGTKSVSYGNIIAVLIEAIKEQQVRIEELERKIDA